MATSRARAGTVPATTTPTAEGHFDLINNTGGEVTVTQAQIIAMLVAQGVLLSDGNAPTDIYSLDFDMKLAGSDATLSDFTVASDEGATLNAGDTIVTTTEDAVILSHTSSYTNLDGGGSRHYAGGVNNRTQALEPLNKFTSITMADGTAVVVAYVAI